MLYGALEAGGTKMVCAVGDENGTILEQVSFPTTTPEETVPPMIAYFKEKNIQSLGIACFGPVDLNKKSSTYGSITTTPKLPWRNYNIVGAFQEALHIPVGFDTDVNGSALGECTWGCTQNVDTSIYITVGTGIGVGVIVDGKPLHGMLHPEAGHVAMIRHPQDAAFHCNCPAHKSCFEGLASGPSIEKRWGKKAIELKDCEEVWEMEAYYIGQALVDYILTLSPEKIILGGGVMHQTQLFPMIREEVKKQLNGYLHTEQLDDLEHYIVPASLHDDQGIMGAIKLAMIAEQEA